MANDSTITILKRLLANISFKDRNKFLFAIIIVAIGNFAIAYAPKMAGNIIDFLSAYVQNGYQFFDMNYLIFMILVIAALYIFGNIATIVSNKIMLDLSRDVSFKLRRRIVKKLNKVPINYLDVTPSGDILARLTNDMITVERLLETDLINLIAQFLVIVLVFIMMLVVNMKLALIYLVALPVQFLLMKFITSKTRNQFKQQQSAVGELNGFMADIFNNHTLIKSYNMENKSIETFDEINKKFYKSYLLSKFFSGFILPVSLIINNVAYICLSIFGAFLIITGDFTIGGFLSFLLYGQMLTAPLTAIANAMYLVQSDFSSAERVFEVLDVDEEENDDIKKDLDVDKVNGGITFVDVDFGYVPKKQLFHEVSLDAKPGMVMAIVGPSGAGKTTLINLLMRFYDIDGGKILIDSENIEDLKRTELRKAFGMVLQDSWIFDGTIAENIAYGKENATMEEIVKVAKFVGCDTFIDTLPDGYDTFISEENSSLSVGEKQLLVLARTILDNPKILILDEATSQMDTRTEAMVTRAMEKLMKDRTTFIIAHRLFTIKNADKIIFMKDGDIKEVGSHDELLKLNGLYAEMYRNASS
ncbi:MAG: ABC transporter ATP-binding protein [Methanobrevibacter sp.]|nr:ABC transporter ATP-binding protein [Methanobrevibacter sp.]